MNHICENILNKANEEAIYNLYLYLLDKVNPEDNESLESIVHRLKNLFKNQKSNIWKERDVLRLKIIENAVKKSTVLANSKISNLTRSKSGLTACSFTRPDGGVSVVFKGTGSGEWIDNGEGLSGIPEENIYMNYENMGKIINIKTIENDYASDQQVEALNWFNKICSENNWDFSKEIRVSGHSKGGNKAQFIAICQGLTDSCYSFDGQGFSPEALEFFKKKYGREYEKRRKVIYSFSADNDYVNVLGKRLVPKENIYYFKSNSGFHYLETILDKNGRLMPQSEQGKISEYVETVCRELMNMNPTLRQYVTLGVMNIFQKYLGEGKPVNNDAVSIEKTVAGIGIAMASLLRRFFREK